MCWVPLSAQVRRKLLQKQGHGTRCEVWTFSRVVRVSVCITRVSVSLASPTPSQTIHQSDPRPISVSASYQIRNFGFQIGEKSKTQWFTTKISGTHSQCSPQVPGWPRRICEGIFSLANVKAQRFSARFGSSLLELPHFLSDFRCNGIWQAKHLAIWLGDCRLYRGNLFSASSIYIFTLCWRLGKNRRLARNDHVERDKDYALCWCFVLCRCAPGDHCPLKYASIINRIFRFFCAWERNGNACVLSGSTHTNLIKFVQLILESTKLCKYVELSSMGLVMECSMPVLHFTSGVKLVVLSMLRCQSCVGKKRCDARNRGTGAVTNQKTTSSWHLPI